MCRLQRVPWKVSPSGSKSRARVRDAALDPVLPTWPTFRDRSLDPTSSSFGIPRVRQ